MAFAAFVHASVPSKLRVEGHDWFGTTMSTSAPQQDLIDFHVGAPEPPGASEPPFSCESESLIDTDLPVFEQKLLTHSSAACPHLRKNSIDVEDILIDFDDCFDKDSLDGEAVEVDDFLPVCEGVEDEAATLPVDNFEALLVLKNLDDLLNATLDESLDSNGNVDDDAQSIEECLEDLDNYLQAIENYETESEESYEQSLQSADIQFGHALLVSKSDVLTKESISKIRQKGQGAENFHSFQDQDSVGKIKLKMSHIVGILNT
ncbi:hypothetical protein D910_08469 [Dendroctonus ponderosae]